MRNGRRAGFVYIGLLIGIAILGAGLSAVSVVWHQSRQREREEELLFIGEQFRQAITRYYLETPRGNAAFPVRLEELLTDARSPDKVKHYLRKLYPDPMTGTTEWGEVRLPAGQLVGVYSKSEAVPLKVAGFSQRDKDFADKPRYSEWVFRSRLPAANPSLAPSAGFAAPGGAAAPPGSAGRTSGAAGGVSAPARPIR